MAKNNAATKDAPAGNPEFPLFFKNPVPLDLTRHVKAGLLPTQDFSFAAATNSIVINAIEFVEAAKHYPIVFTLGEAPLPAAILGLEGKNYFVSDKGAWQEGTYAPAYVRKYPFVFLDVPERKQFLLCIDEEAAAFKKTGGKGTLPLYNGEEASDLTRNALEFCTAFHNHHLITRTFCEALQAEGLLVPSQSTTKLASGREINLGGFQVIDEKKVNELSDDKVLEFHKKGWLPLIYFALMSSSHWKKIADMAGLREPKK